MLFRQRNRLIRARKMTLFGDIRQRGRKKRHKRAAAFASMREQVQRMQAGTCGSVGCKVLG
ncbi:MAG TPA: hypothetical protein DEH06_02410 [Alistipes sp.]|nr:hypothetical protein [Alistipes sp.]HCN14336.1 hypothetical protein [Alistipes sp.]